MKSILLHRNIGRYSNAEELTRRGQDGANGTSMKETQTGLEDGNHHPWGYEVFSLCSGETPEQKEDKSMPADWCTMTAKGLSPQSIDAAFPLMVNGVEPEVGVGSEVLGAPQTKLSPQPRRVNGRLECAAGEAERENGAHPILVSGSGLKRPMSQAPSVAVASQPRLVIAGQRHLARPVANYKGADESMVQNEDVHRQEDARRVVDSSIVKEEHQPVPDVSSCAEQMREYQKPGGSEQLDHRPCSIDRGQKDQADSIKDKRRPTSAAVVLAAAALGPQEVRGDDYRFRGNHVDSPPSSLRPSLAPGKENKENIAACTNQVLDGLQCAKPPPLKPPSRAFDDESRRRGGLSLRTIH